MLLNVHGAAAWLSHNKSALAPLATLPFVSLSWTYFSPGSDVSSFYRPFCSCCRDLPQRLHRTCDLLWRLSSCQHASSTLRVPLVTLTFRTSWYPWSCWRYLSWSLGDEDVVVKSQAFLQMQASAKNCDVPIVGIGAIVPRAITCSIASIFHTPFTPSPAPSFTFPTP